MSAFRDGQYIHVVDKYTFRQILDDMQSSGVAFNKNKRGEILELAAIIYDEILNDEMTERIDECLNKAIKERVFDQSNS